MSVYGVQMGPRRLTVQFGRDLETRSNNNDNFGRVSLSLLVPGPPSSNRRRIVAFGPLSLSYLHMDGLRLILVKMTSAHYYNLPPRPPRRADLYPRGSPQGG